MENYELWHDERKRKVTACARSEYFVRNEASEHRLICRSNYWERKDSDLYCDGVLLKRRHGLTYQKLKEARRLYTWKITLENHCLNCKCIKLLPFMKEQDSSLRHETR